MSLSTTPQSNTQLRLMARRPAAINVAIVKQDDSPLNLTGATVVMVVAKPKHRGGTVMATVAATAVNLTLGLVRLDVQGDDLNLDPTYNYPYVITLTSAEGYKSTVVQGQIDIEPNPDLAVPADYSTVAAPLSLTVELLADNKITVKVNHHPDSVLLAFQNAALAAASSSAINAAETEADLVQTNLNVGYTESARIASYAARDAAAASAAAALVSKDAAAVSATGAATSAANAAASAATASVAAAETLQYAGRLIIVNGGTVDLDDTISDGFFVSYKVTGNTIIEGRAFVEGSYIFERDSSVYGGWSYRTLEPGTVVVPPPDPTPPTAPTLVVDNASQTELVATVTGGTDNVAVTQYRTRIDGAAWLVGGVPRTFTGLAIGSAHTIDAQAGDAVNNWSPSTSWSGSTAFPADAYRDAVMVDTPTYLWRMNDADTGAAQVVAKLGSGAGALTAAAGVAFGGADLGDGLTSASFVGGAGTLDVTPYANNVQTFCTSFLVSNTGIASYADTIWNLPNGWMAIAISPTGGVTFRYTDGFGADHILASAAGVVVANVPCLISCRYDGANMHILKNGAVVATLASANLGMAVVAGTPTIPSPRVSLAGFAVWAATAPSNARLLAHAQAAGLA